MQKVTLICVGKLKERFYAEAASEYVKRLGRAARGAAAGESIPGPD